MKVFKIVRKPLMICFFLFTTWLLAKDFWEQPFEKWKREDVLRILSDSPWAKSETFNEVLGGKGAGVGGEKEMYYRFTARFFSARPAPHAYVRMAPILNQ